MHIKKKHFLLFIITLIIIGCNTYDVHKNYYTNKLDFPVIYLYSYDPYGNITIIIKEKFRIHNMLYIDCGQYIHDKQNFQHEKFSHICLYITNISERCIKTALFTNGQSAGYKLISTISVQVQIKNNKYNKFSITVSKSFFNNPLTISANFVRNEDIRQLMYEEMSDKLISMILYFIQTNS